MILAERLTEMRYAAARRLAPDAHARLERHIARLRDGKARERVASVGTRAPSFALATADGGRVSSTELLARGPLVVSFFRGTWCSFCAAELEALAEEYPAIAEAGAEFVAVAGEHPDASAAWRAEHPLPFPIAFDPDFAVAAAYGVAYDLDDDARDLYEHAFGRDLAAPSGDGSRRLTLPARFVIDMSGVIRDVSADPDFRERPEPSALRPILETVTPKGKPPAAKPVTSR